MERAKQPLFKSVDCVMLHVSDLRAGMDFYCSNLGLKVIWRSDTAVGLGMADDEAEIVLQTERRYQEVDIKVESVTQAVEEIRQAGGEIVSGPFDIRIGKCAVIRDPFGNEYIILDSTKGTFITDEDGNIIGQRPGS